MRAYGGDVRGEERDGHASRAQTRAIARHHFGTLASCVRSDRSLTIRVAFFAASMSRACRCFSFRFREGAER